jgi:ketosteroid isomerase-like protein
MNGIAATLVIGSALVAAGCSGPAEREFGKTDAQTIRQRTTAFRELFNGKDTAKLLNLYTPEAIFMPPNAPTIRGRAAIENFYKELYAQGAADLVVEPGDVGGHGPIAYESGTYSLNRRPPDGQATRDRGKFLFIWRDVRGEWLIEYTIWSSDLPERVPIGN